MRSTLVVPGSHGGFGCSGGLLRCWMGESDISATSACVSACFESQHASLVVAVIPPRSQSIWMLSPPL
ncbi:hypothetical protein L210DRAFT_61578 [Boletus edulis BED1]|uniref:Uncharacterized protein n=1 Tax=Boletus edulis BED1 TaxID=1328754 RepID=A0AAD4BGG4_BOLED|nr:hypothetical protein L210DRAFT_61578 [Boletus edulis BED1]